MIKEADVKSCTIQSYEIGIRKLYTAVEVGELPFSIDDASRPESDFARVSTSFAVDAKLTRQMETEDVQFSRVSLPTRLDNRVLDLRVSRAKGDELTARHRPTKPSSECPLPFATCFENTSTRKGLSRFTPQNSKAPLPSRVLPSSRCNTLTVRTYRRVGADWQDKHSSLSRLNWPSKCALPVTWNECTRLLPCSERKIPTLTDT